jgi:hypothetical protein
MNPYLMHHMAQAHRADLVREAEGYRRARLHARPPVLTRLTARIPHFTERHGSRSRVVTPSTGEPPNPRRTA